MNEPTTWTVRSSETSFPECLMVVPTGKSGTMPETTRQWYRLHNRAITEFHRSMMGATSDVKRSERAILALAAGIDQYIGSVPDHADYLSAEHIIDPLVYGFTSALDYDCGRLDCGTLSDWAESQRERWSSLIGGES